MFIKPVSEEQASSEVKQIYLSLKEAFASQTLPVFFTYIGAFPEYLLYITEQLVNNLQDNAFASLVSDLNTDVIKNIHAKLQKSDDTKEWLVLYRNAPSFYYFQKDLQSISLINSKLACIFIALREAVKGWAVAAKKLPSQSERYRDEAGKTMNDDDFIFDKAIIEKYQNIKPGNTEKENLGEEKKRPLVLRQNKLAKGIPRSLEKNLLPEYLKICHEDFRRLMREDYFWTLRVQLEEKVLSTLANFPHLVFSPYNVIVNLTRGYDNYYELLYILSENFPTLVMQRLMFSAYMIV